MSAPWPALVLTGAAACQGGSASTDEGAQNRADLRRVNCAAALDRCLNRLGANRAICMERLLSSSRRL